MRSRGRAARIAVAAVGIGFVLAGPAWLPALLTVLGAAPRVAVVSRNVAWAVDVVVVMALIGMPVLASRPLPSGGRGRAARPVGAHTRIEYRSPMELNHCYPLRVGLLQEGAGGGSDQEEGLDHLRVQWSMIQFVADEPEPVLTIIPSSAHCRVSPSQREVRLAQGEDAVAEFEILPEKIPASDRGRCALNIDFDYGGRSVKRVQVPVQIQQTLRVGRWQLSRASWPAFVAAGAGLNVAATLFQVYDFTAQVFRAPPYLLWFVLSLVAGSAVLGLGTHLWSRTARRRMMTVG